MDDRLSARSDSRTYAILGAAITVHQTLGNGFLESVYREALAIEFAMRQIPYAAEVTCRIRYKGHLLHGHCRMDFVCCDDVVVEVKARSTCGPAEAAQVLNYLAASGHTVALLLNFGSQRLDYRRFILSKPVPQTP